MTDSKGPDSLTAEFERLLTPGRGKVYRAALRDGVIVALDRGLLGLAIVAGALLLLRLVLLGTGRGLEWGWAFDGWLLAAGLIVPVGVTFVRAMGRSPSSRETAERLDLALADHNRIATALWLLDRDRATPFARAAVRDGLAALGPCASASPYVDRVQSRWRRGAMLGALSVMLVIVAGLCGGLRPPLAADDTLVSARELGPSDRHPGGTLDRKRGDLERPRGEPPRTTHPHSAARADLARPAGPAAPTLNVPVAGRAGGGSRARARPTNQAASASGESTDASVTSQEGPSPESKRSRARRARESKVTGGERPSQQADGSAVSQGSAGGGLASPVTHDWAQRAQTAEGEDPEEEESTEEVEDEAESSSQRGGIQPSLKDRNEAPSRDLGISGDEGPPGTGRGGPTPPKKSRGTASLVLGVPIPDFVRGRAGPGMTKITHERVEPSPMPGDPSSAVDVRPRSLPEMPCRRFDVPAAFASVVRSYLVTLHSADRRPPDTGPSAPDQQPPQE